MVRKKTYVIGHALTPETPIIGSSALPKVYPTETAVQAAVSLEGCPVTAGYGPSEPTDRHIGAVDNVRVTDAGDVLYRALITDDEYATQLANSEINLTPRLTHESVDGSGAGCLEVESCTFKELLTTPVCSDGINGVVTVSTDTTPPTIPGKYDFNDG